MHFQHSDPIWRDFPELAAGLLTADGITTDADVDQPVGRLSDIAKSRLATASVAELPEIQAWRRTFSKMGLKPTQYRCAAEALLRRFTKEGTLPRIHPLVDLCNAVSLAFAIPVAVFDVSKITEYVEVRRAGGDETCVTFSGETEHPYVDEVVFVDGARQVHARRWTNRQSGQSAVRESTTAVLIVAEALHDTADADMRRLTTALADELSAAWSGTPRAALLTATEPRFDF